MSLDINTLHQLHCKELLHHLQQTLPIRVYRVTPWLGVIG
jgi:hypothetical protein